MSGRQRFARWSNPVYRFGLVTFGGTILLALLFATYWALDGLFAWLLAANLVALLTYGYDKRVAGSGRTRVPETVLLFLVWVGGTAGAFIGMRWFRHKTAKGSFQVKFWLAVVLQVVLIGAYILWWR